MKILDVFSIMSGLRLNYTNLVLFLGVGKEKGLRKYGAVDRDVKRRGSQLLIWIYLKEKILQK